MAAQRRNAGRATRDELSRLLATAYLRLLASRAHNSREVAHIGPPDSPLMPCYAPPVERESSCQITANHWQERRST